MSGWRFWKPTRIRQEFVASFFSQAAVPIPSSRGIDQLSFVVLDTETTGLDTKNDFILSFGALRIEKLSIKINSAVEWYPSSPKTGKTTAAIHGIIGTEPTEDIPDFVRKLLCYIGDSIIVGHHIGFDLEMLIKACKPFGLDYFPNPTLDTMSLAIRLDHGIQVDRSRINPEHYSLDSLCSRYAIFPADRHTAAGDAFLTAQLLLRLLSEARSKGIQTYGGLFR